MSITDDSEDKVRRNVVSASSLVIIFATLGLEPNAILHIFAGKVTDAPIAPWKIYFITAAILTYLGLRYRFSQAPGTLRSHLKSEWRNVVFRLASSQIENELNNFSRTKLYKSAPSMDEPLKKLITRRNGDEPLNTPSFENLNIGLDQTYPRISGTASFSLLVGDPQHLYHNNTIHFKISKARNIMLLLKAATSVLAYSKTSVNLLVPYALISCALLIVFFKLSNAVYGAFL